MSTKKKLLSYNTIKHPLVAQFFDQFEDTHLASHYTREAIAFYQQHKNNGTLNAPMVEGSTTGSTKDTFKSIEKEKSPDSTPDATTSDTGASDTLEVSDDGFNTPFDFSTDVKDHEKE